MINSAPCGSAVPGLRHSASKMASSGLRNDHVETSPMTIRIGTSERDGTFHSQGRALQTILERQPQLGPVEVLESHSASIDNANRLHAGEIEFGFMASNWIGRAKRGEAPFGAPVDLRMAAPMNAGPLFFVARA